jgi:hypothetical protein
VKKGEIKTHIYKKQHKDILMINNDNEDNIIIIAIIIIIPITQE